MNSIKSRYIRLWITITDKDVRTVLEDLVFAITRQHMKIDLDKATDNNRISIYPEYLYNGKFFIRMNIYVDFDDLLIKTIGLFMDAHKNNVENIIMHLIEENIDIISYDNNTYNKQEVIE